MLATSATASEAVRASMRKREEREGRVDTYLSVPYGRGGYVMRAYPYQEGSFRWWELIPHEPFTEPPRRH